MQSASVAVTTAGRSKGVVLATAWGLTLLASLLPAIVWREIGGGDLAQGIGYRAVAAACAVVLGWALVPQLRLYLTVLFALLVTGDLLVPALVASGVTKVASDGSGRPLAEQGLRLLPALACWAALALSGLRREEYFLARGQMDATAEPVRWLDIRPGERWSRVGLNVGVVMVLVTVIVLAINLRGTLPDAAGLLSILPAALLFAALNAFGENFAYRAALLPGLLPAVGKNQALLLTATLFAVGHFYSFPPGVLGVLLPGFLGWVIGKSMIETRGFAWAWLLQLPLDLLMFIVLLLPGVFQ